MVEFGWINSNMGCIETWLKDMRKRCATGLIVIWDVLKPFRQRRRVAMLLD